MERDEGRGEWKERREGEGGWRKRKEGEGRGGTGGATKGLQMR